MGAHTALTGLFWYLAFLFSTTLHEAAHAWAALMGGDPTAYRGGQVSLSPLPHIRREPIGMVIVPLLTAFTQGWAVGWASVPFDSAWEERYPRRAAWMAAAGPAANLALAAAAFGALRLGLALGAFRAPSVVRYEMLVQPVAGAPGLEYLALALSILLTLNVLLGVFNLLPLPPLDGHTAIGLLLPERLAHAFVRWVRTPAFSFLGLVVAWRLFPRLAGPLFGIVLELLHPGARYR